MVDIIQQLFALDINMCMETKLIREILEGFVYL